MKVIVAGSRDLQVTDIDIERGLILLVGGVTVRDEIVSGGAKGVDRCGERFAIDHGIGLTVYPADWQRHGKAAGNVRNEVMARHADAALIFINDHPTPGSANMATWMLALRKPVRVVLVD